MLFVRRIFLQLMAARLSPLETKAEDFATAYNKWATKARVSSPYSPDLHDQFYKLGLSDKFRKLETEINRMALKANGNN